MRYRTAGELVASFIGTQNSLVIPVALLKKVGDLEAALLLSQIIYWSERKPDDDGWFAKSFPEWEDEILLSRHQINRALDKLKTIYHDGKPLVEIEKRRSKYHNLAPTLHYRYSPEVFGHMLISQNDLQESADHDLQKTADYNLQKTADHIPENTAESTSENKSALAGPKDAQLDALPSLAKGEQSEKRKLSRTTLESDLDKRDLQANNPVLMGAICHAWGIKPGGWAGTLARLLTNRKGKGAWDIELPDGALSPLDVLAFGLWYKAEAQEGQYNIQGLPRVPQSVVNNIMRFFASHAYERYREQARLTLRQVWPALDWDADADADANGPEGPLEAFPGHQPDDHSQTKKEAPQGVNMDIKKPPMPKVLGRDERGYQKLDMSEFDAWWDKLSEDERYQFLRDQMRGMGGGAQWPESNPNKRGGS